MPIVQQSTTPYNQTASNEQDVPFINDPQFLPDNIPLVDAILGTNRAYTPPPLPNDDAANVFRAIIAAASQNNSNADQLKQEFIKRGLPANSKGNTFGDNEDWSSSAINSLPIMPSTTSHQGVKDFYNSLPLGSLYREAESKNGHQIPTGVIKRKLSPTIDNINNDPSVTKGGLTGFAAGLFNNAIATPATELGGLASYAGWGNGLRDWGLARQRAAQADSGLGSAIGQIGGDIAPLAVASGAGPLGAAAALFAEGAGGSLARTTESGSNNTQNIENALLAGGGNAAALGLLKYLKIGKSLGGDVIKGAIANAATSTGIEEGQHFLDPQNTPNNVTMGDVALNAAFGGALGALPHVIPRRTTPPEELEAPNVTPEPPPNTSKVPDIEPEQTPNDSVIDRNISTEDEIPSTPPTMEENDTIPSMEQEQQSVVNDIPIQDVPDYSNHTMLPRLVDDVIKQGDDGSYKRSLGIYKTFEKSINASLDGMKIPENIIPRVNVSGNTIGDIRRNFNNSIDTIVDRINGPELANAPQEVKDSLLSKITNAKNIENEQIIPSLLKSYENAINKNVPENNIYDYLNIPNNELMELAREDNEYGNNARIVLQTRKQIDQLLNLNSTNENTTPASLRLVNSFREDLDNVHNSQVFENFGIRRSNNLYRPFQYADEDTLNELSTVSTPYIKQTAQIEQAIRNPQQQHLNYAYNDLINNITKLSDNDLKNMMDTNENVEHNPYSNIAKVIASQEIDRRNSRPIEQVQAEEANRINIINC